MDTQKFPGSAITTHWREGNAGEHRITTLERSRFSNGFFQCFSIPKFFSLSQLAASAASLVSKGKKRARRSVFSRILKLFNLKGPLLYLFTSFFSGEGHVKDPKRHPSFF